MASTMTDQEIRDAIRAFVAEAYDPAITLAEWWDRLADSGWAVPTWPEEWLGKGLPGAAARTVAEELRAANVPGPPAGLGLLLAGPTILAHGTDEQTRPLPPADRQRPGGVVSAVLRAGCGLRPRVAPDQGAA